MHDHNQFPNTDTAIGQLLGTDIPMQIPDNSIKVTSDNNLTFGEPRQNSLYAKLDAQHMHAHALCNCTHTVCLELNTRGNYSVLRIPQSIAMAQCTKRLQAFSLK